MKYFWISLLLCFCSPLFANKVVNVYAWGGEIPQHVLQEFKRDTGITVNFSTYDNNETMYAKLRSSQQSIYDVVLPSAYFVERMRKKGMLSKLDRKKIPNLRHLDPLFTNQEYDKGNQYSVPFIWGATGIFYNQQHVKHPPQSWQDLWKPEWREQLMLLDDSREAFALALLSLHYSPNDANPEHIKEAYQKLLTLAPNIKLFASDGIQALLIDEDTVIGMAWNGDALKAQAENKAVTFVFPDEGFVFWIDCLAIPNHPPHPAEAYQFINYLLEPRIAAEVALKEGHAITNREGKKRLPARIRNNPTVYPTHETLKRGYVQRDVSEQTIALFNQYWQQLKLAF